MALTDLGSRTSGQRAYWRIGNGESVRVLKDKWILGIQGNIIPILHGMENRRFSSLISEGRWDESIIRRHFDPYIASKILQTPLISTDESDIRFWINDSKGRYTVRNGYHAACEHLLPPPNQSEYTLESWWKFI